MDRHAVRQPAAIAGFPPGDPGAPSLAEPPRRQSDLSPEIWFPWFLPVGRLT